jgi:hypothetical protein
MRHEHDIVGLSVVPTNAIWLLENPEAIGYAFIGDGFSRTLIGGVDALRDGSKVILEYGSTGEKLVDPNYTIYVGKTMYKNLTTAQA